MCQLGLDSTAVVFVAVVVVTECICSAERSPDVMKAAWIRVHAVHGDFCRSVGLRAFLQIMSVCFEDKSKNKERSSAAHTQAI